MPFEPSAPPIHVAVCEDDDDLRGILLQGLPHFGFRVSGVSSAEVLEGLLDGGEIHVLILDVGLPGEDGYSVALRLRRERPGLGIIMLTARGRLEDRVRGLEGGADLYFVKPVDLRELAAAIGSLRRRMVPPDPRPGTPRAWCLDPIHSEVRTPSGVPVGVTVGECTVLSVLQAAAGETVGRSALLLALGWSGDGAGTHRLEVLISRLRKKVGQASPEDPLPLRTRHGDGYALLGVWGPGA